MERLDKVLNRLIQSMECDLEVNDFEFEIYRMQLKEYLDNGEA